MLALVGDVVDDGVELLGSEGDDAVLGLPGEGVAGPQDVGDEVGAAAFDLTDEVGQADAGWDGGYEVQVVFDASDGVYGGAEVLGSAGDDPVELGLDGFADEGKAVLGAPGDVIIQAAIGHWASRWALGSGDGWGNYSRGGGEWLAAGGRA